MPSAYEEHREAILECEVDLKRTEEDTLRTIERNLQAAKERLVLSAGSEFGTILNTELRKMRAGIKQLFSRYAEQPVRILKELQSFGSREDETALHMNSGDIGAEVREVIGKSRETICRQVATAYLDTLDREGRGGDLRGKLKKELERAIRTFVERSGFSRRQITDANDEIDWLAVQIGRDLGFFPTPRSGRLSIGDVPKDTQSN